MKKQLAITGKIISGARQGAFFTQLDWVQEQCIEKLGFAPWPGTLNLEIRLDQVAVIEDMRLKNGIELTAPDANYCSGYVFPVSVGGIPSAVVIPSDDVRVHEKNIIEIIAPRYLKETLGVKDGDSISLTVGRPFKNKKIRVNAVLLDLDGTLIDSAPIYYQIIDIVFERLGVPPVSRKILQDAMDDGDFDWDYVLPDSMKPRKEKLIAEARLIIDEVAPPMFRQQIKLIPGAAEVCAKIAARNLKIGLVTSTPRDYLSAKLVPLREAEIEDLLQVIVTADDVANKKPHAEPLIEGSRQLGAAVEQCVYVGDTRVDIRAGIAAGMKTVGVLTGFDDFKTLEKEKPDAILSSIARLFETIII